MQSKQQTEKQIKTKQNKTNKQTNKQTKKHLKARYKIYGIMYNVPEEEREKGIKDLFDEIMAETFPNQSPDEIDIQG